MSRRYLLDTNIISALLRQPGGGVRRKLGRIGHENVYTSIVVVSELRFGIAKIGSARLSLQLEEVLAPMEAVPFAAPSDHVYGELRAELERRGTPIGANDLWIAAQALHDRSVLVTDNVREFGLVPELAIENWLRPDED